MGREQEKHEARTAQDSFNRTIGVLGIKGSSLRQGLFTKEVSPPMESSAQTEVFMHLLVPFLYERAKLDSQLHLGSPGLGWVLNDRIATFSRRHKHQVC